MLTLATLAAALALALGETLVEHEYGVDHDQLDDGYGYHVSPVVPPTDPT